MITVIECVPKGHYLSLIISEREIDELGYVLNSKTIMSKLNRYLFIKKMYQNYVVLLINKTKLKVYSQNKNLYISYSYDNDILLMLDFDNNLNILKKYQINYIVIKDLEIVDKVKYDDNHYERYLKLVIIIKIVKFILKKYNSLIA